MRKNIWIQLLCAIILTIVLLSSMVACKISIEADIPPMPYPSQPLPQPPEDNSNPEDNEVIPPNTNSSTTVPPIQESTSNSSSSNAGNTTQTPAVQNDVYVRSITNGLNVRSAPTTSSTVLGTLNTNDMVLFIEKQGSWYKTVYKNTTGYVSASSQYTNLYSLPRSSNATIEKIISLGYTRLGYKYVYGAIRLHNGKGIFLKDFKDNEYDCSSLMQYIFYYGGNILLDVTTRTQVVQGQHIDKSKVRRGDLLFFTNANRKNNVGVEKIGHVGIYLGNNYMLHTSSDYAVIEPMSKTRQSYLIEGRRFL